MNNEIKSLFRVLGDIQGTNTCFLIHGHQFPQGAKVTFIRIICDILTQKKETHRLQLTMGGEKLSFY